MGGGVTELMTALSAYRIPALLTYKGGGGEEGTAGGASDASHGDGKEGQGPGEVVAARTSAELEAVEEHELNDAARAARDAAAQQQQQQP